MKNRFKSIASKSVEQAQFFTPRIRTPQGRFDVNRFFPANTSRANFGGSFGFNNFNSFNNGFGFQNITAGGTTGRASGSTTSKSIGDFLTLAPGIMDLTKDAIGVAASIGALIQAFSYEPPAPADPVELAGNRVSSYQVPDSLEAKMINFANTKAGGDLTRVNYDQVNGKVSIQKRFFDQFYNSLSKAEQKAFKKANNQASASDNKSSAWEEAILIEQLKRERAKTKAETKKFTLEAKKAEVEIKKQNLADQKKADAEIAAILKSADAKVTAMTIPTTPAVKKNALNKAKTDFAAIKSDLANVPAKKTMLERAQALEQARTKLEAIHTVLVAQGKTAEATEILTLMKTLEYEAQATNIRRAF